MKEAVAARQQVLSLDEKQPVIPQDLQLKVAEVKESLSVLDSFRLQLEPSLRYDMSAMSPSKSQVDIVPSIVDLKSLLHSKIVAEEL